MSRPMSADDTELWRAVVVWRRFSSDGTSFESTSHYGPYRTRGAARSAVSRAEREAAESPDWARKEMAACAVERGEIEWRAA